MKKIEKMLRKIADKYDIRVGVKLECVSYISKNPERFGVSVDYTSYEISINKGIPLYFGSVSEIKKELKQILKDGGQKFLSKTKKVRN